ncbi:MAG: hypothetical protein ABSH29_07150 [Acidimicrobiales bacterium]
MTNPTYVKFFEEFGIDDVSSVGGKNASLGEMYQKLSGKGVRIPNGYDSMSLNPDTVLKTTRTVLELEHRRAGISRKELAPNTAGGG